MSKKNTIKLTMNIIFQQVISNAVSTKSMHTILSTSGHLHLSRCSHVNEDKPPAIEQDEMGFKL